MMSLYDGLGIENKDASNGNPPSDVAGWSSSYKLLQSQLQAKKASTNKKNRSVSRMAPVVDLKKTVEIDYGLHFDQQTGKLQKIKREPPPTQSHLLPFISTGPGPSITGAVDEYDPLRPNEYEEMVKLRREEKDRLIEEDRRRQSEEDKKRRQDRDRDRLRDDDEDRHHRERGHDDQELERSRKRRDEEDEEEYDRPNRGGHSGAAIAPPPSLIEDDSSMIHNNKPEAPPPSGGSVASKIMAKYGYREGQGLGKSEQGMSMALQIEKTSKRGGKIIHERDIIKANVDAQRDALSNTNIMKNPSKVILLENMVGAAEVDDELEPETAEECAKYGKVTRCVIFIIPDVLEDVAVRIFVEFDRMESAIKAVVDMNGRFFGGRTVQATFYNLDKFRRMDYMEDVDAP